MLYLLLLTPLVTVVVYRCCRLLLNYREARSFKVPIIVLPFSFEDPIWILVRPLFSWIEKLPFGFGNWYRYTDIGWPAIDGVETTSMLGETFVLVSPRRSQIVTAYPPAVERIYRDKNMILPAPFKDVFTTFGQNVSSTNGADWQRHRKITAQAFNEKNSRYVWDESLKRTAEMLSSVPGAVTWTLGTIRSQMELVAMHVLVVAAFGQDTDLTATGAGHKLSLMDSLGFILKNVFISIIFSGLKLPDQLLPPVLRKLKLSVQEFQSYMEYSVLQHMQSSRTNVSQQDGSTSLLEAMVTANEAEKEQLQKSGSRPSYLSHSELYGNIFVFNLAGYETTAGTMSFALPYLAAYPEVQDWLFKEINKKYSHSSRKNYEETYPKLVRCLAFMHEVLRLASPAPQMMRTPTTPTTVPISPSSSITVNPDTLIAGHFPAIQLSPRWGHDALEFNPKRFIARSHSGEETLASAPEGAMFIAWVFGARVCPGKKFSQVEFVAVIAHMLSLYTVELAKDESETNETAKRKLLSVMDDRYFNVSVHFKRPDDAAIRLVRRASAQREKVSER